MKTLITRKIGMTSTIAEDGAVKAVTLLSADPNVVTQVKTSETDGYSAVQLGFGKGKNLGKTMLGHLKNSKAMPAIIREFRVAELPEETSVGAELTADVFSVGDAVQVQGMSKGKGWGGTIKRHGFHRTRATHGSKAHERRPGSIGSMYPQKVFRGKRMAGQTGHDTVTVKNLKIALVDTDKNVIGVFGAVPGPRKGIVLIKENKR